MSHMPLGAHGVAISTIFNVEIFKQIQQILEKFQYSDTDTSKLKSIQIQIQTDTDQSICIQIQILEKGLYLYLYPSEYLYLLNPIVRMTELQRQRLQPCFPLLFHRLFAFFSCAACHAC